MKHLHVDDYVRVREDLPNLSIQKGTVGVVRSTWFAPRTAYEVEFHPIGLSHETRALLVEEQLDLEEGPLFDEQRISRQ